MEEKNKKGHSLAYRNDIDGMRAISILLVAIYHVNQRYLPVGRIGVDVFFVISGYLITSILLKEHSKGIYSLKQFYVRRVKRIFPVLFISLTVYFSTIAIFFKDGLKYMAEHVFCSILMTLNFWRLRDQYYPQPQFLKYDFVIPNWTLAIQEQFYLLWPLALAYLFRKEKKTKYTILILATVLSYFLMVILVYFEPIVRLASFIPFCRSWELTVGCLLALIEFQKAKQGRQKILIEGHNDIKQQLLNETDQIMPSNKVIKSQSQYYQKIYKDGSFSSLFATLCIIVYAFIPTYTNNPGYETPLVIFCVVWIIINKNSYYNRKILGSKPMCFIGKISYSFYIWHQGLIKLIMIDQYYVAAVIGIIGISVYQLEDRIRISKHPLTVKLILGFGLILLIAALLVRFI